ncbi:hypothetical protein [Ruegeria arenilitoris]|uniref:hypothetical protein n=1 Tax=Ruegeria arenilitoris TaxID=1173585 RepID=UPI001479A63C|nr:hypothetical protein [Ruegeria arenilitoris]
MRRIDEEAEYFDSPAVIGFFVSGLHQLEQLKRTKHEKLSVLGQLIPYDVR